MLKRLISRLFSLSIRAQLLLLILIVALPSAGIIVYSGIQLRQDSISDARRETQKLADILAAEQQTLLSAAEQMLISLAQLPDIPRRNTAAIKPILKKLHGMNAWYSNIFFADRSGHVWAQAVDAKPFSISDRRYFMNTMATGRFSSGEYVTSRATGKTAFNFAYPLKDQHGKLAGTVNTGIKIIYFESILERSRMTPGTSYLLLDHRGIILGSSLRPDQYSGKPYDPQLFKQMQEGPDVRTFFGHDITGESCIITTKKLSLPGEQSPYIYIQTGIPIEQVLIVSNKTLVANMTLLSSFVLFAIVFAWFVGSRSIANRLTALEGAARKLASGDLHVRVSDPVTGGELGRLGQSFDHMATQIAEREQHLRESEERFRSIFYGTMDGIVLMDAAREMFTMANKTMCDMLKCTEDDLLSMNPVTIHPADVMPRVRQHLEEAARGVFTTIQEVPVKRCDGSIFYADITASALHLKGALYFLGVFRDVTERRRASEEQHKLVSIIETSPDLIGIADMEGKLLYLNSAGLKLVGLDTIETVRNKPVRDFHFDTDYSKFETEILPTILKNNRWTGEIAYRHFKTGLPVPVDMNGFLIRDTLSGQPIALANISRDITERKHAEEEKQKLHNQLLQSQKMESIGQLAGGIAHDFNNILSAIIGYGNIIQMKMPASDPLRSNVDHILESADRATQLTHSLLAFSRKQVMRMMPAYLNEIIVRQEQLLRRIIGEDISMKTIFHSNPVIMADKSQIEQILMNLATNARDAMQKGGSLTFETDLLDITREFVSAHGFGTPGTYAVISVTDTGIGMDEETQKNIFNPFFTTKEIGRGTGLGMAIIYGIIKQHNGYINVYSQVGKGTTFKIFIPVHHGEPEQRAASMPETDIMTGTETILLAEDDATLRTLFRDVLTEYGYSVVVADNGEVAIQKFNEGKGKIHLCIIDMIMPKRSGKDVYDEIQRIEPGAKVIFSSGYTADKVQLENLPKGIEFIAKPSPPQVLLKKVRAVLDGN